MTISEYRTAHGLSLEAFGLLIGKTKGHVHAIESDGRCSAKLALEIEKVTGGQVDAASINDEIAAARNVKAA